MPPNDLKFRTSMVFTTRNIHGAFKDQKEILKYLLTGKMRKAAPLSVI